MMGFKLLLSLFLHELAKVVAPALLEEEIILLKQVKTRLDLLIGQLEVKEAALKGQQAAAALKS